MAHLVELVPTNESFAGLAPAYFGLLFNDLEQSALWCERVEARAADRGEDLARLWVRDIRGQLAIRLGRAADACAAYDEAREMTRRMGYAEPCVVLWARHGATAYAAAGRIAEAREVVAWLESCSASLPCRWPRIAAATGRALIAEREGDLTSAGEQHATALGLHAGLPMVLEEIETLIAFGAFLRRTGQPVRARPLLARALRMSEDIECAWFAEQCSAELTIAGGRRERRARDDQGLTSQERRVAQLIATGLSNRDVAARLFLSINTVETHLKRVYGKLGVDSRSRLIALAARDGELFATDDGDGRSHGG
jgi:DNA-binding CsgD family transcriptional regulator